jgi:hypothetical protein
MVQPFESEEPIHYGRHAEGGGGGPKEERGKRPESETPNPKPPQGGSGTARPQGNQGGSEKK